MFISADIHTATKRSRRRLFRYHHRSAPSFAARKLRMAASRKRYPAAAHRYAQRLRPILTPLDIIENQRNGFPLQRPPRPALALRTRAALKLHTLKRASLKQHHNPYNSKQERLRRSLDQPNPDLRWLKDVLLRQPSSSRNKLGQPLPAWASPTPAVTHLTHHSGNRKLAVRSPQAEQPRRSAASYAAKAPRFSPAAAMPTARSTQPGSFWQQPYYRFLGPLQLMLVALAFTFLPRGLRWFLFVLAIPCLAFGLVITVREDQVAQGRAEPFRSELFPALASVLRFFSSEPPHALGLRLRNIVGIAGIGLILLIGALFGLDETAGVMLSPLILISLIVAMYFLFIRPKKHPR